MKHVTLADFEIEDVVKKKYKELYDLINAAKVGEIIVVPESMGYKENDEKSTTENNLQNVKRISDHLNPKWTRNETLKGYKFAMVIGKKVIDAEAAVPAYNRFILITVEAKGAEAIKTEKTVIPAEAVVEEILAD